MSFIYNPGSGEPKDHVRLLVSDVDANAPLDARLEDEDILDLLTLYGNRFKAAAAAARSLAAKFIRKFEGASGGPGPSRTRAQDLMALAARLEEQAVGGGSLLLGAGFASVAEKATAAADTNRVQPAFRRGMMDHPETSQGG